MLDISSTTGGLLTPRMSTAQRNGIATPATGLLVYDLNTLSFWQYDGTQWVELLSGADSDWVQPSGGLIYNDQGRVAIGRSTAYATLHLSDTSNFLIGDSVSGSGFKLLYYGVKGAFRVGYLTNPFGGYNYHRFWDYDSTGYYSFASGQNSRAKGFGSFAHGSFGWADGSSSVAFFGNAGGNNSYTFGGNSRGRGSFTVEGTADDEGGIAMYGYTAGRYGVAIGGGTTGLGASSSREDYAVAIGWNADARGQASIALGPSDAFGYNAFSTGWVTEARGNYSSTFGYRTNSYASTSMALGRYNVIQGDSAIWVSTDPVLQIGDGTSNTNRSNSFTVLKNGQTAIGYDYPTAMLQVSSALGSLGTTVNTANATLLLGTTTAGMAFDPNQIESIGSALHLNYGSAQDVISNIGGGNFGVGTQTPDRHVEVEGADDQYLRITSTGGTRIAGLEIKRSGNGYSDWRIWNQGGLLYIGQSNDDLATVVDVVRVGGSSLCPASDNTVTLGLNALRWTAVYATNGTIQTSDRRLKMNIEPLGYGLEEVLMMSPVSYQWKDGQGESKVGLIAQEVRELVPEVVSVGGDPDQVLGMNYAELVPVLINAIKELHTQISEQSERIDELEAAQYTGAR